MRFVLLLAVLLAVGAPLALFLLSTGTVITFDPPPGVIGTAATVKVRLENPHGARHVTVSVEQQGARHVLGEVSEPPSRWLFWRKKLSPRVLTFTNKGSRMPALKDGKAWIAVEAESNDLRARVDSRSIEVQVITQPPAVTADGNQHYINQGGAELVVFTPSGYWSDTGVRVGAHDFRSFPLPGGAKGERFSLFAFSWDTPADAEPVVFARNPAGTEAIARFWHKVFPKRFRSRRLELSEAFIAKAVAELDPKGAGDLLERFLKINGAMRRANNQVLAGLRTTTDQRFLWKEPFTQLANSKVESQFADRRIYTYQGKTVDEQVHLGFDLSVTANVPVTAANSGRVAHAAALGIYGNCVVIDHGYALQSIYAHLNAIDVKPGQSVAKGEVIGRSGSTGLAGGDHLHFSMQIDGVQVNPVEWWDGHWIQDRIRSKVTF